MSVSAEGTVLTETSVIPRTIFDLRLRVNVQEGTFFVAAFPKFGVEIALWHLGHVILVQEFTLVALLAQPSQPMLANHRFFATDVSEGAHPSFPTSSL